MFMRAQNCFRNRPQSLCCQSSQFPFVACFLQSDKYLQSDIHRNPKVRVFLIEALLPKCSITTLSPPKAKTTRARKNKHQEELVRIFSDMKLPNYNEDDVLSLSSSEKRRYLSSKLEMWEMRSHLSEGELPPDFEKFEEQFLLADEKSRLKDAKLRICENLRDAALTVFKKMHNSK
ncbi:unnamed protein product [Oikopleura dioica]|uniref:Uncharacterized protein n=1 Tax=Oikopleura dioica TaxID=34765 RepID=E4WWK1_OIKDI|nr:unnamed protein product [Oikopleura dioica]CBY35249.1 unnamed protein product [Oikopleura dioica]